MRTRWTTLVIALAACGAAKKPAPQAAIASALGAATGPIVMGHLDMEVIASTVKARTADLRDCYLRELMKQPQLTGEVKFKFIIGADGAVTGSEVRSSTLNSPDAERCMLPVISGLTFPPPKGGGIVVVLYPFIFKPG